MAKQPQQPADEEPAPRTLEDILASGGIRGEVPGCPTGLARPMGVRKKDKKDEPESPPPTGEERR